MITQVNVLTLTNTMSTSCLPDAFFSICVLLLVFVAVADPVLESSTPGAGEYDGNFTPPSCSLGLDAIFGASPQVPPSTEATPTAQAAPALAQVPPAAPEASAAAPSAQVPPAAP